MSRYLVDENLRRELAPHLRALGVASVDVREVGYAGVDDLEIWEYAQANGLVVVTGDAGFVALAVTAPRHAGLVLSRLAGRLGPSSVVPSARERDRRP